MTQFTLKKGQDSYTLDIAGKASEAGVIIGTWATTTDNQIVITKAGGSTIGLDPVSWCFNSWNQLELASAGGKVLNFHADADVVPLYTIGPKSVLRVQPDQNLPFAIELRGEWSFTGDHSLGLTIGDTTSSIDGFLDDPQSRFVYHFSNREDLSQSYELLFDGDWVPAKDEDGNAVVAEDGTPKLVFQYTGVDGGRKTFDLPKGATIKRGVNQLVYRYDKGNRTHEVQIAGLLKITRDFEIVYLIDRQTAAGAGSTELRVGAKLANKNASGDLQLVFAKKDGTPGATVGIQGQFKGVRGDTSVLVGFAFSQTRSGNVVSSTVGFNGRLDVKDKARITWTFASPNVAARTFTFEIGTQIKFGPAKGGIDSILNMKLANGKVQAITFLLGARF